VDVKGDRRRCDLVRDRRADRVRDRAVVPADPSRRRLPAHVQPRRAAVRASEARHGRHSVRDRNTRASASALLPGRGARAMERGRARARGRHRRRPAGLRATARRRDARAHRGSRRAGRRTVDSARVGGGQSGAVIFEEVRSGGCMSYLVGCPETCSGVLVDPELSQIDRYLALASKTGVRLHHLIDTHTHADHFSATRELGRRLGVPTVMHRASPAPYVDVRVDDGETIIAGRLRLRVLHTPGHTNDAMSLVLADRVLTGDTLLRLGTGRTDLPTGDPEALYDSLFGTLLRLDDTLQVFPAHNYKG